MSIFQDIAAGLQPRAADMTLRDYFAAKALPQAWEAEFAMRRHYDEATFNHHHVEPDAVARRAYCIADSLLKARQE